MFPGARCPTVARIFVFALRLIVTSPCCLPVSVLSVSHLRPPDGWKATQLTPVITISASFPTGAHQQIASNPYKGAYLAAATFS